MWEVGKFMGHLFGSTQKHCNTSKHPQSATVSHSLPFSHKIACRCATFRALCSSKNLFSYALYSSITITVLPILHYTPPPR